jgi:hypothetical protein
MSKQFMPQRMHGIKSTHDQMGNSHEFMHRMDDQSMGMSGQGSGNGGQLEINTLMAQKMLIEAKINEINHFRGDSYEKVIGQQQQLLTNNAPSKTCPPRNSSCSRNAQRRRPKSRLGS